MIDGVRNRELLLRIDRRLDLTEDHIRQTAEHISETKEHIRETKEHIRQSNEQMREFRITMQENRQAIVDLRTTLHQWNTRQEKMMREMLAATGEMIASLRESRREGVEEARAQRAALFAILDELKGRGPAAA
jgi:septal ring factor EnvC (AmiA/AmiB activator)